MSLHGPFLAARYNQESCDTEGSHIYHSESVHGPGPIRHMYKAASSTGRFNSNINTWFRFQAFGRISINFWTQVPEIIKALSWQQGKQEEDGWHFLPFHME